MRAEWEDTHLVEPWAQAMGEHGDYWRQVLINPLVLSLAERVAAGADPFEPSFFEPLLRGLPSSLARAGGAAPAATPLDGVSVVDLGCGEGCLGRLLCARCADYVGLDSSEALLAIARRRAGAGSRARFLAAELEHRSAAGLAAAGSPRMVVAAVVLDHMAEVTGFLGTLAGWARALPGDVPLLLVNLAAERFPPVKAEAVRAGEPALSSRAGEHTLHQRALIESCQREVTVWLRSRRTYERLFRDAGLFIRRCEPLFFHREHAQAVADQKDDASRRPIFWAWLLSARHGEVPAPGAIEWPEHSDAAALRASVSSTAAAPLAPAAAAAAPPGPQVGAPAPSAAAAPEGAPVPAEAPRPRVFDFRPRAFIIRVHNMGGELYAVLSGAAKMMDGGQELMTFRAGEVLGDLETPDASGQCGSFPFDVVASDEGCRVALFPEPTASAVLARSHDIGSRFFRLLRDRLRLALWHYDIRELVGEYLECGNERLEKRLLHRCARALLWAAAIERRGRADSFGEEVAFIDPETIARRFKPGTERIDFGVVIRQLHLLRMIDAFPGAALRKEEEARAGASWETLVASATRRHLLGEPLDPGLQATVRAHAGRLRVSGQLTKDGNRTRQFQDVVDDLAAAVPRPGFRERIERWSAYIARAHRFWEDRNPWLIVLRDVPALRRIALGDAAVIDHTLAARAEYLLTESRRPTWELVTAQAFPARRKDYIAILDDFVAADLARDTQLAFSSEAGA